MRVLIAGCGYVGSRLARDLADSSNEVHGLRRRTDALPPGVHPVRADLGAEKPLPPLPIVDALVYAASAGARTEEAYRRIYVEGLRRTLEALGENGSALARVIFVSSTAVYGPSESWVDERTEPSPDSPTGRVLLEAEACLAPYEGRAVSLRLAGIYGPGRTRLVRQVFEDAPSDSPDSAFGNRIHVDDCAGALAHLLAMREPESIYCGVDDAPAPLGEVRDFLASRLGVTRDRNRIAEGNERGGKRISNARLLASGYVLRVPTYREGYAPIVDAFLRGEGRDAARRQS